MSELLRDIESYQRAEAARIGCMAVVGALAGATIEIRLGLPFSDVVGGVAGGSGISSMMTAWYLECREQQHLETIRQQHTAAEQSD